MTNTDTSINRTLRPHQPDAGPKGTGGYLGGNWEWCWDWHNKPDEYWVAADLLTGYEYTIEAWTDLDYAGKHLATQMKVLGNHGPDGVLINGTASNVAANADSDVSPGARYVHRVKARNGTGLSPESGYFNARLPEPARRERQLRAGKLFRHRRPDRRRAARHRLGTHSHHTLCPSPITMQRPMKTFRASRPRSPSTPATHAWPSPSPPPKIRRTTIAKASRTTSAMPCPMILRWWEGDCGVGEPNLNWPPAWYRWPQWENQRRKMAMSNETKDVAYLEIKLQGGSLENYRFGHADFEQTCAALHQAKFEPVSDFEEREIGAGRKRGAMVAIQFVSGQQKDSGTNGLTFGTRRLFWLRDADFDTTIEALESARFVKFNRLSELFD